MGCNSSKNATDPQKPEKVPVAPEAVKPSPALPNLVNGGAAPVPEEEKEQNQETQTQKVAKELLLNALKDGSFSVALDNTISLSITEKAKDMFLKANENGELAAALEAVKPPNELQNGEILVEGNAAAKKSFLFCC
eukprot:gnl/MRDRNA2_/MRDRNA2_131082_c0_seq1.p1 gnl/MRDRNA2_/MRDRNA2_131082_c0~~gnl/MRDRNA2_/MRDRNA2_131082_c0_seq1.p1  ORF type:complete len:136 (+),score=47.09 gnl/MRDRNA2_/MRDRNA2_131082_c0_seq1:104-511(+)